MPDEGWYQLNAPQKEVVFDDYIEDVKEFPDLYEKCHRSYFDSIWLKNYPEIKLGSTAGSPSVSSVWTGGGYLTTSPTAGRKRRSG